MNYAGRDGVNVADISRKPYPAALLAVHCPRDSRPPIEADPERCG